MKIPESELSILLINLESHDCSHILSSLKQLNYDLRLEFILNLEELNLKLDSHHESLILFISGNSEVSAHEVLRLCRRGRSSPFILISNGIGEEEVANIMKAGAEDVVSMSRPERLIQVMSRVIREREMKDKETQANKIAEQASAAKEQMLAIVSHDIKNPLSVIQLEAQMLLKIAERHGKSLLSEEVKIQSNRILKTTERLKNLISDLLDKSKKENSLSHLNKTQSDISKLFQEVLDSQRPLIKQKNILVRTSFKDNLATEVDKNKMYQVLMNLLSNAIKFAPINGHIQLAIEELDEDYIFIVTNDGPGLNTDDLQMVFEKYWTGKVTNQTGTGLGLFICKTIIEAHGGHIYVENVAPTGTKFWFTIPKPSKREINTIWMKDNKKRILVIDDDDDLREVICWALEREGYSVHSYSDPKEALENLKKGRHIPHLLVLDYHMDGMKGGLFLKNKDEIDHPEVKDCPVVMISASPEEVSLETSPALYKEVLSKPLDLEALIKNIKQYVEVPKVPHTF